MKPLILLAAATSQVKSQINAPHPFNQNPLVNTTNSLQNPLLHSHFVGYNATLPQQLSAVDQFLNESAYQNFTQDVVPLEDRSGWINVTISVNDTDSETTENLLSKEQTRRKRDHFIEDISNEPEIIDNLESEDIFLPAEEQYHIKRDHSEDSDLLDSEDLDYEEYFDDDGKLKRRKLPDFDDFVATSKPSAKPTAKPSANPTIIPTPVPTLPPTIAPTPAPSIMPSPAPSSQPSSHPSNQPSSQPSSHPSGQPSSQPSGQPSQQPSQQPSNQPSRQPTARPSQQPSSKPSAQPSHQPNSRPSAMPSTQPTSIPSLQPSTQPSGQPSTQPSQQPSTQPSEQPSTQPSSQPSTQPISDPTTQPTVQPSVLPTNLPTAQPTVWPSGQPTLQPSTQPSSQPSTQPSTQPISDPTTQPTTQPTVQPSALPTNLPTSQPTVWPSGQPTTQPSQQPSTQPSSGPSSQPSQQPSQQPSNQPTAKPSVKPTANPSAAPASRPTSKPTSKPSAVPSTQPTSHPSYQPTVQPSSEPSSQPSNQPSSQPSGQPTGKPSIQPTARPSRIPTTQPSRQPTSEPSAQPSADPSTQPSSQPSKHPSTQPSAQPSTQPTVLPSRQPTVAPSTQPSGDPTAQPSIQPSAQPAALPTGQPSVSPTGQPTLGPTTQPSAVPSSQPSVVPSRLPTAIPTGQPVPMPTSQPSAAPSVSPSSDPSVQPSRQPNSTPSSQPSTQPSAKPQAFPTALPTPKPTPLPTPKPTQNPTVAPTTAQPSPNNSTVVINNHKTVTDTTSPIITGLGAAGGLLAGALFTYLGIKEYNKRFNKVAPNADKRSSTTETASNSSEESGKTSLLPAKEIVLHDAARNLVIRFHNKEQFEFYGQHMRYRDEMLQSIKAANSEQGAWLEEYLVNVEKESKLGNAATLVNDQESRERVQAIFALIELDQEQKTKFNDFLNALADPEQGTSFYTRNYGSPPPQIVSNENGFDINKEGELFLFENFEIVERKQKKKKKGEKNKDDANTPKNRIILNKKFDLTYDTTHVEEYYELDSNNNLTAKPDPIYLLDKEGNLLIFKNDEQVAKYLEFLRYQSTIEDSLRKADVERDLVNELRNYLTELKSATGPLDAEKLQSLFEDKRLAEFVQAATIDDNAKEQFAHFIAYIANLDSDGVYYRQYFGDQPRVINKDSASFSTSLDGCIFIYENHRLFDPQKYQISAERNSVTYLDDSGQEIKTSDFCIDKNGNAIVYNTSKVQGYSRIKNDDTIELVDYEPTQPVFYLDQHNDLIKFSDPSHMDAYCSIEDFINKAKDEAQKQNSEIDLNWLTNFDQGNNHPNVSAEETQRLQKLLSVVKGELKLSSYFEQYCQTSAEILEKENSYHFKDGNLLLYSNFRNLDATEQREGGSSFINEEDGKVILFDTVVAEGFYRRDKSNAVTFATHAVPEPVYMLDLNNRMLKFDSQSSVDAYQNFAFYQHNFVELLREKDDSAADWLKQYLEQIKQAAPNKTEVDNLVQDAAALTKLDEIFTTLELGYNNKQHFRDFLKFSGGVIDATAYYREYYSNPPQLLAIEKNYHIADGNLILHQATSDGVIENIFAPGFYKQSLEDGLQYQEVKPIYFLNNDNKMMRFQGSQQFEQYKTYHNYAANLVQFVREIAGSYDAERFENFIATAKNKDSIPSLEENLEMENLLKTLNFNQNQTTQLKEFLQSLRDPQTTEAHYKKYYGDLPVILKESSDYGIINGNLFLYQNFRDLPENSSEADKNSPRFVDKDSKKVVLYDAIAESGFYCQVSNDRVEYRNYVEPEKIYLVNQKRNEVYELKGADEFEAFKKFIVTSHAAKEGVTEEFYLNNFGELPRLFKLPTDCRIDEENNLVINADNRVISNYYELDEKLSTRSVTSMRRRQVTQEDIGSALAELAAQAKTQQLQFKEINIEAKETVDQATETDADNINKKAGGAKQRGLQTTSPERFKYPLRIGATNAGEDRDRIETFDPSGVYEHSSREALAFLKHLESKESDAQNSGSTQETNSSIKVLPDTTDQKKLEITKVYTQGKNSPKGLSSKNTNTATEPTIPGADKRPSTAGAITHRITRRSTLARRDGETTTPNRPSTAGTLSSSSKGGSAAQTPFSPTTKTNLNYQQEQQTTPRTPNRRLFNSSLTRPSDILQAAAAISRSFDAAETDSKEVDQTRVSRSFDAAETASHKVDKKLTVPSIHFVSPKLSVSAVQSVSREADTKPTVQQRPTSSPKGRPTSAQNNRLTNRATKDQTATNSETTFTADTKPVSASSPKGQPPSARNYSPRHLRLSNKTATEAASDNKSETVVPRAEHKSFLKKSENPASLKAKESIAAEQKFDAAIAKFSATAPASSHVVDPNNPFARDGFTRPTTATPLRRLTGRNGDVRTSDYQARVNEAAEAQAKRPSTATATTRKSVTPLSKPRENEK